MSVYVAIKKGKGTLVGFMYSFFLRIYLSVLFLRIRLPSKIYLSLSLARPLCSFDTVALAFTLMHIYS